MPPNTCIYHAAQLASESLLRRLDRDAYFRPFFHLMVKDGIMRADHASWDCADMSGRFVDAWILARQMFDWPMTEEEEGVRRYLLSLQAEDGLFYDQQLTNHESRITDQTADMFCQSRALLGLTSWLLESGEFAIQQRIERLIEGLWKIAVKKGDFCYYPGHRYSPDGWEGVSAYAYKDLGHRALPAYGVLQILPLTRYWEATGSPSAERLIRGLLKFFVRESGVVNEDGTFTGHLHSWGILPSMVGVLRYAMEIGDDKLIQWCKKVYDFIIANSSSFGWVPDGIQAGDGIETGETCCITDLIHLGVKLAKCPDGSGCSLRRHGYDDCFDYIEVMARNQLLENQIRDVSRFTFDSPETEAMALGAYDSWVMPNGLTGCSELGLEGCCTASAVRAIYLVWKHAITHSGNEVRVNLMLSRRSEWLDTIDYQPFEGRFSVLVHKPVDVLIRIPSWIERTSLKSKVKHSGDGNVLRLEGIPGSRIDLEFPIPERQTVEEIRGHTYQLSWRGITLMKIEPPGEIYPIFQRTLDSMAACSMDLNRLKTKPSVEW